MLNKFQQFFQKKLAQSDEQTTDHSINLAAAALLIEVARADLELDDREQNKIIELLQTTLQLPEEDIHSLITLATEESESASSLFEFTTLINEHYSDEQKQVLMEQLWHVAFADDELDKYEEHLLRRIADLIHLPHRIFIKTKHRAEKN